MNAYRTLLRGLSYGLGISSLFWVGGAYLARHEVRHEARLLVKDGHGAARDVRELLKA